MTLKYLRNQELRQEIVQAVRADGVERYSDRQRALHKGHIKAVSAELDCLPETDEEATLDELYQAICEAVDTQYQPNAGQQWALRRENLKAIHRALAGGGSDE